MLRIHCPFCGPRDHAEFEYGGDATVAYPPLDASEDAWVSAVYERADPKGPHKELWRHARGCGAWLIVERDTVTHTITSVTCAHPGWEQAAAPPAGATEGSEA